MTRFSDDQRGPLRRMKLVATGAFVAMGLIYFLSLPYDHSVIVGPIRWDHINAFAEAAMIGALADWFAVVALFRHPLGIPLWHTAIIPNKKDEIGKNLAVFLETRLLSKENLGREIDRFSIASSTAGWLEVRDNRLKLNKWIAEAGARMIRAFDDSTVRSMVGDFIYRRLKNLDASSLLANGLSLIVETGRHEVIIDSTLRRIADWLPTHRDTVREFVRGAVTRTLKWGSVLVPESMIDKATDRTLEALIQVILDAADDPEHPLRADLSERFSDAIERLKSDPEWRNRVESWKIEALDSPKLQEMIESAWEKGKERFLRDLENESSGTRDNLQSLIDDFAARLGTDQNLRDTIDERLKTVAVSLLDQHHGEIGSLVQRIIESWDAKQLSREIELNLGKDLQFIRLNGTFIGGLVGLVIHLLS